MFVGFVENFDKEFEKGIASVVVLCNEVGGETSAITMLPNLSFARQSSQTCSESRAMVVGCEKVVVFLPWNKGPCLESMFSKIYSM